MAEQTEQPGKFETLRDIMATLRSPEGCPWDREQTHLSIKANLLEECYEAIEAIEKGDDKKLCEELGDLLMQIVFHARIAEEQKRFTTEDVIQGISAKLVRRHPHVFGGANAQSAQDSWNHWETTKERERGEGVSMLDGIPRIMPALAQSQSLQGRAARVGFDWPSVEQVIDKVAEETGELKQAVGRERKTEELGDLLFALTNVARHLELDSEEALRGANGRFRRRFAHLEKVCKEHGVALNSLSLAEMDKLWEEAKKAEDASH